MNFLILTAFILLPPYAYAQNEGECCMPDPIGGATTENVDLANEAISKKKAEDNAKQTAKNLKAIEKADITETLTKKYATVVKLNYESHKRTVRSLLKTSTQDKSDQRFTYSQLKSAVAKDPDAAFAKLFADMRAQNNGEDFLWMKDPVEVDRFKQIFTAVANGKERDDVAEKIAKEMAKKTNDQYRKAAKAAYLDKGKGYEDLQFGIKHQTVGADIPNDMDSNEALENFQSNYSDVFGCVTTYQDKLAAKSSTADISTIVEPKVEHDEILGTAEIKTTPFVCDEANNPFDDNSFALSQETIDQLKKCATDFEKNCKNPKNIKIGIESCASTLRPNTDKDSKLPPGTTNLKLSTMRAQAAKDVLLSNSFLSSHLEKDSIFVDGNGKNRGDDGKPTGTCGGSPQDRFRMEPWTGMSVCSKNKMETNCENAFEKDKWRCIEKLDPKDPKNTYAKYRYVRTTISAECEPQKNSSAPGMTVHTNVSNSLKTDEKPAPLVLEESKKLVCFQPFLHEKNKSSNSGQFKFFNMGGNGTVKKRPGGPRICPVVGG